MTARSISPATDRPRLRRPPRGSTINLIQRKAPTTTKDVGLLVRVVLAVVAVVVVLAPIVLPVVVAAAAVVMIVATVFVTSVVVFGLIGIVVEDSSLDRIPLRSSN